MKFIGQTPRKCRCGYCVGSGDSKKCNRALKRGSKQKTLKEINKKLEKEED